MLCLAVMLSVMVVGAGAAFSDQDKIENTEAVDACSALNIINGYEDGAFHPERNIKRAEVTKMICVALNGGEEPNTSTNAKPTFTDVRGTIYAWAEGYIEACVAQGIVDGVGGTRFAPASNVTGAQLAKMLLVSLGYNATTEKFTGNAWETNVNVRASQKHLYDGLEKMDTSAPVTRDQAAQMVWNAMQAYEVEYKDGVLQDKVVGTTNDKVTLLYDRYDAWVSVGTLTKVNSTDLSITMSAADKVASDYKEDDSVVDFTKLNQDYSALLGQKVKVIFTAKNLDEVIGVFATKNNTVVTAYQNELDVENAKIDLDGKLYTLESNGVTVIKDGTTEAKNWNAVDFKDTVSPDVVTLIDNDGNGKIDTAVIKTVDVAKVTFVSSTQIIADVLGDGKGGNTYKTADENIAEGLAKDDFVVITHNLYKDNLDIVKADKATGKVTATKGSSAGYTDYQIGETWYTAFSDRAEINAAVKSGNDAEYIAVNNILFYAKKLSGEATLSDILFVALVGQDGLSDTKAVVMMPNGSKDTVTLKDKNYNKDNSADGSKEAPIVAGQFYEFNKSGTEYELSAVSTAPDYYGDYTYCGQKNLNATATNDDNITGVEVPAYVDDVAAIADTADVILYLPLQNDGATHETTIANAKKFEIKHITGKQLKSNSAKLNASNLEVASLGAFSSDVDGLKRASVVAVEFKGNLAAWNTATNELSSNNHYGFIVSKPVNKDNGIEFQMFTDDANKDAVTVWADKTNANNFAKGTVIGYTTIKEVDGKNVIVDAEKVKATPDTIADVKDDNSVIVVNNTEMDLDDFNTVIYTNSYNDTITKTVNGTPDEAKDGRTNILYAADSFAIIDSNEIVGQVYASHAVTDTTGLTDLSSIQWTNATTGETWAAGERAKIYNNAVMNLSITAKNACKVTVQVAGGATVDHTYAAGETYEFKSIKVVGAVTVSAAAVDTPSTSNVVLTKAGYVDKGLKYGSNAEMNQLTFTVENGAAQIPTISFGANGTDNAKFSATLKDGADNPVTLVPSDSRTAFYYEIKCANTTVDEGTYKATITVGDKTITQDIVVAKAKADIKLNLADPTDSAAMPTASNNSGTGYSSVASTTWEKSADSNNWSDNAGANAATGNYYRATITIDADAHYTFAGVTGASIATGTKYDVTSVTPNPAGDSVTIVVTMNAVV